MLRILPFWILLCCPVIAEEGPPPAVPPVKAPAIAGTALVGKWHLEMELNGIRVTAVTHYEAGGTFQSQATLVIDGESTALAVKGTWKLDEATLVSTVSESNSPDLIAVGEVSKDEILELSATTLRYRDEDGQVFRETRDEPGAKPGGKVLGKPVPPGELKAILGAIGEMERRFREADYDGIIKGTHPSLIAQAGGDQELRKSLEIVVRAMQSGEVKMGDVRLENPAELHDAGEEWVCFVPKQNTVEAGGRTVHSQSFFVAVRKKEGKDWKLLDGAGFGRNPEMLWTLLPALPRDVAIPAVKKEVAGE